jgi:hypothetical protein
MLQLKHVAGSQPDGDLGHVENLGNAPGDGLDQRLLVGKSTCVLRPFAQDDFTVVGSAEEFSIQPGLPATAQAVPHGEGAKQFTLDVANAMPAEFYDFRPSAEEMTFGEQMAHIADGNVFRFEQITGVQPPFHFDPAKSVPLTSSRDQDAGTVVGLRYRRAAADHA